MNKETEILKELNYATINSKQFNIEQNNSNKLKKQNTASINNATLSADITPSFSDILISEEEINGSKRNININLRHDSISHILSKTYNYIRFIKS